jgi:beta-lactamase regulating signal transducer with metallopeptidase domain
MILLWMVYAATVAVLFGAGALALENVVRQRGWPIRWLWLGALVGSTLIPTILAIDSPARAADGVSASESAGRLVLQLDPAAVVPSVSADIDAFLVGAWAFLSLAVLFFVAMSAVSLRRSARAWRTRAVDGVDVWVAADFGPAVVGFLRSRIVLPEWILARSLAERSMLLAHECEHVGARDSYLILSAIILVVAFPWNPAIWWQARRLRHALEVDCDTRVLRRGVEPRAYSRVLLDVTEQGVAHRLAIAALSESRTFLERRIRHMLAPKPQNWEARATCATVLASALIFLACSTDAPRAAGGAGAAMVEEPLLLRCLSPGEAAELLGPVLRRDSGMTVTHSAHAPRVLTVRATPAQLRNVKALLEQYEGAGSAACASQPAADVTR